MLKRVIVGVSIVAVLFTAVPPAYAVNGDGGSCVLSLTISFSGTPGLRSAALGPLSPSYSLSFGQPVDLDANLIDTGTQGCVYNLGGLNPFRSTSISTSPDTSGDVWTCEAMVGTGTLTQSWSPSPPGQITSALYAIAGTWGSWTMTIVDLGLSFAATIHLTFDPLNIADPTQCASSAGVSSLHLVGTEFFQDP